MIQSDPCSFPPSLLATAVILTLWYYYVYFQFYSSRFSYLPCRTMIPILSSLLSNPILLSCYLSFPSLFSPSLPCLFASLSMFFLLFLPYSITFFYLLPFINQSSFPFQSCRLFTLTFPLFISSLSHPPYIPFIFIPYVLAPFWNDFLIISLFTTSLFSFLNYPIMTCSFLSVLLPPYVLNMLWWKWVGLWGELSFITHHLPDPGHINYNSRTGHLCTHTLAGPIREGSVVECSSTANPP